MSVIAEILALVNSNTEKTLDELIIGEKRLVANDSTLAIANDGNNSFYFIPKVDGVLRISVKVENPYGDLVSFYIQLQDETNNTNEQSESFSVSRGENTTVHSDFKIIKEHKYTASVFPSDFSNAPTIDNILFQGQIVDFNYFETGEI